MRAIEPIIKHIKAKLQAQSEQKRLAQPHLATYAFQEEKNNYQAPIHSEASLPVYILHGFLKFLYDRRKITLEQIDAIITLPLPALSFFPDVANKHLHVNIEDLRQEYSTKLKLFVSDKITFEDIQCIGSEDHPLLNAEVRERLLQGSSLEEEILLIENFKESLDFYLYKQLKKNIEAHYVRIKHAIHGDDKAQKIAEVLTGIDHDFYHKRLGNCYEFYKELIQKRLLSVLEQKRIGLAKPESYEKIEELIKELDKKRLKNSREHKPLPLILEKGFLGDKLVQLLLSSTEQGIQNALDFIRQLDQDRQADFIKEYGKAFRFKLEESMLEKAMKDLQQIHNLISHIGVHIKRLKMDNSQKKWQWQQILKYILTQNHEDFYHGYYLPLYEKNEQNWDHELAKLLTQQGEMQDAFACQEKIEPEKESAYYEGHYLRPYVQSNGQLQAQKSLIVQPGRNSTPFFIRNTLREFWFGFFCHALAPSRNAHVALVTKPNTNEMIQSEDVYLEYTCFERFLSNREIMGKDYKKPQKSLSDFNDEIASVLLDFCRSYTMENFAAIIIPRLLLGIAIDGENMGFTKKGGSSVSFVSFGLSKDYSKPSAESTEEIWLDPNPFYRQDYGVIYPLDFYLSDHFFEQAQNVLYVANQSAEKIFNEAIGAILRKQFSVNDIIHYLANSFKMPTDRVKDIEDFSEFFLKELSNRLQHIDQWLFELRVWRTSDKRFHHRFDLKNYLKESLGKHYQLGYYRVNGEYIFQSRNLRFLLQESLSSENDRRQRSRDIIGFIPADHLPINHALPSWQKIQAAFYDSFNHPVLKKLKAIADKKEYMFNITEDIRHEWLMEMKDVCKSKNANDRACCLYLVGILYSIPEEYRADMVPVLVEQVHAMNSPARKEAGHPSLAASLAHGDSFIHQLSVKNHLARSPSTSQNQPLLTGTPVAQAVHESPSEAAAALWSQSVADLPSDLPSHKLAKSVAIPTEPDGTTFASTIPASTAMTSVPSMVSVVSGPGEPSKRMAIEVVSSRSRKNSNQLP